MGAFFGATYGVEQALWFAPDGHKPEEPATFRRPESFRYVGEECKAVRTSVGCLEISGYAKYEITGPGAEGWLSHLLANKVPATGRMTLAPMLNEAGKLIGDFSLAKLGDERFMIFGSGAAENYHMRWFERHLPADGSVTVRALGLSLCGLSIAGPNAGKVLAGLAGEDVSTAALPFMAIREMDLGLVPAIVGRVSFTGSLGYEIWVKPEYLPTLHDAIMAAGAQYDIRQVGGRALMSLRLEKNWGTWAREYRPIYGPFEAGLGRFVALSKNDFIGREAAAKEKETGGERALTVFTVDGNDVDVIGDEPVYHAGQCVGWITSGGYAHAAGKSVAMGYVPRDIAAETEGFEIEILGQVYKATPQAEPLFDPEAHEMRT
jgi:dimethylglycine dehydrogenase